MDSVESSISSNAIVLTTIKDGQCLTSTRKNHDRGINMHVVTEVQHIVILAEHHLLDYKGAVSYTHLHLNSGGELRIVANAFLPYPDVLDETFGFHEVIAQTGRFKVYRAIMTRQAKKG